MSDDSLVSTCPMFLPERQVTAPAVEKYIQPPVSAIAEPEVRSDETAISDNSKAPYRPAVFQNPKAAKQFAKAFKQDVKDLPPDLSEEGRAQRVAFRKHIKTQAAAAGMASLTFLSPLPFTAGGLLVNRVLSGPFPMDVKPGIAFAENGMKLDFKFRDMESPDRETADPKNDHSPAHPGRESPAVGIPGHRRGMRSSEKPKKIDTYVEGGPGPDFGTSLGKYKAGSFTMKVNQPAAKSSNERS